MNPLSLFAGAGLVTKLIAAGSIALALLGAYGVWHHKIATKYYARGWDAAIAAIAAQDRRAIDAAKKARAAVVDCVDRDGMRWDQSAGKCIGG